MSTRLKRPSILKQLGVTALLLAFLAYFGFSALTGQFGFESQEKLVEDIRLLEAEEVRLNAEIEDYRKRIALFDPARLDPDVLTEIARTRLGMAHPDDIIVMLDQ